MVNGEGTLEQSSMSKEELRRLFTLDDGTVSDTHDCGGCERCPSKNFEGLHGSADGAAWEEQDDEADQRKLLAGIVAASMAFASVFRKAELVPVIWTGCGNVASCQLPRPVQWTRYGSGQEMATPHPVQLSGCGVNNRTPPEGPSWRATIGEVQEHRLVPWVCLRLRFLRL